MIVDVHTHLWDSTEKLGPAWESRLRAAMRQPWDRPDASPVAFEEAMRSVDFALVLGMVCRSAGINIAIADVAQRVAHRPDKFIGLAGLDPTGAGWESQFEQAVAAGLAGVVLCPSMQGLDVTDQPARSLFARCAARNWPVVIHGDFHHVGASCCTLDQPVKLDAVLREFPTLRILLTHVGDPFVTETLVMMARHRHLYADVAGVARRPWQLYQILIAAQERGVDGQLLLGSDFPFARPQETALELYAVHSMTRGTSLPCVMQETLRGIIYRDALACLGLTPPAAAPPHKAAPTSALAAKGALG